jgi:glycosyltransferase involved in cell wall biosynthesis
VWLSNDMPKVSVIIPCYNQGEYLADAVDSVLNQTFTDFEIIIINDGSTDQATISLLAGYEKPKTRIIHTPNRGLASARNTAISEAQGEYILPLDADDRIGKHYLQSAAAILDNDDQIGIVYCLAEKFGAVQDKWELPEFTPLKLLRDNLIFCSALYRKQDWVSIGGYNQNMRYGWEDWNFWLSMIEIGKKVIRIPEVMFFYRVNSNSMNSSMTFTQKVLMMFNLLMNHKKLYLTNITSLLLHRGLHGKKL